MKHLSFRIRILLVIALGILLSTMAGVWQSSRRIQEEGESALIDKSKAILSRLQSARKFVAQQGGLDTAVEKVKTQFPDGTVSKEAKEDLLNHVPIVSAMKIGKEDAERDNYEFRVMADRPRNKDNQATEHELEILGQFEREPELKEIIEKDADYVKVYRPVHLSEKQGCLKCHGHPDTSPWGNGKDILGYEMENWKDGQLHGAFGVISSLSQVKEASTGATKVLIIWSSVIVILVMAGGYLLIRPGLMELGAVASSLHVSGRSVAESANEISESSGELSESSSTSAAAIEETTATTEEISSMIRLNADHAAEASSLSQNAEELALKGKDEVARLIEVMGEISTSSKQVQDIINVVDDIAFQTNLLALNASVEAARAGEQGRGFAVVADAVRGLAQRSATSAKEIAKLIKESSSRVEAGNKIAQASGETLEEIVKAVAKVVQLNTEIATASREQATGVNGINAAISDLDRATQKNAAGAQHAALAAEKLAGQSTELFALVARLVSVLNEKNSGGNDRAA